MYTFRLFQQYPQLIHGVFDKKVGNVDFRFGSETEVNKSRHHIRQLLPHGQLVELNQVHGSKILVLDSASTFKLFPRPSLRYFQVSQYTNSADGLITPLSQILFLLKTADCCPVFFFDPTRYVIGLIHVGWRGAAHGVHRQAITILQEQYYSNPRDILVGVGPGICPKCYTSTKLHPEQKEVNWQPFVKKVRDRWHVDFAGFLVKGLKALGVSHNHIEVMPICTFENTAFFSHRRSQQTGEPEGRFASVIGLKS